MVPAAVPSVVEEKEDENEGGNDDDWAESKEELERWGMDYEIMTKTEEQGEEGKGKGLRFEEVRKFWQ